MTKRPRIPAKHPEAPSYDRAQTLAHHAKLEKEQLEEQKRDQKKAQKALEQGMSKLTPEQRKEQRKHAREFKRQNEVLKRSMGGTVHKEFALPGRNEPCRCGSGKKFKKCCLSKRPVRYTLIHRASDNAYRHDGKILVYRSQHKAEMGLRGLGAEGFFVGGMGSDNWAAFKAQFKDQYEEV